MEKKIIVLQVVNLFYSGGIREFLLNYYRNIDRNKIQFYFLFQRANKLDIDDEIINLGGKIFYGPVMYKNPKEYSKFLTDLLKNHKEIDIIHSHLNLRNLLPLYIAKKCNIKIRISHCHKNENNESFIDKIKRKIICRMIKYCSTNLCACSRNSATYMYGKNKNVFIIRNAINFQKFKFNINYRNELRNEFNLGDKIVIGHVGNFSKEKNQTFLISQFYEFHKINKNSVLLLIGDGENKNNCMQLVKHLQLNESVYFIGTRKDAYKFYSAFDVFVFPSKSEGFGMSLLEAECNGLPCLVSKDINSEACIDDLCIKLSLNDKNWYQVICKMVKEKRNSIDNSKLSNYDINSNAIILTNYYCNLLSKKSANI